VLAGPLAQALDGGADDRALLVAEQAALAGVGVEAEHADHGATVRREEALAQGAGQEATDADDAGDVEAQRDLAQRHVDRGQDDAQAWADHQHREVVDAGAGGEIFGVAGEAKALGATAGLVDRRGDQGAAAWIGEHEVDAADQRRHLPGGARGSDRARARAPRGRGWPTRRLARRSPWWRRGRRRAHAAGPRRRPTQSPARKRSAAPRRSSSSGPMPAGSPCVTTRAASACLAVVIAWASEDGAAADMPGSDDIGRSPVGVKGRAS
jgi:hypothetical protein